MANFVRQVQEQEMWSQLVLFYFFLSEFEPIVACSLHRDGHKQGPDSPGPKSSQCKKVSILEWRDHPYPNFYPEISPGPGPGPKWTVECHTDLYSWCVTYKRNLYMHETVCAPFHSVCKKKKKKMPTYRPTVKILGRLTGTWSLNRNKTKKIWVGWQQANYFLRMAQRKA